MKLSYRGASYEYDPTQVDMVSSGAVGRYRGQSYPLTYPRHVPVPQRTSNLVYRGAVYETPATGDTQSIAPVEQTKVCLIAEAPSCKVRVLKTQPLWTSELENTHRLNIQRRLQKRIEAAKARGDARLLLQLEQEMQQIA